MRTVSDLMTPDPIFVRPTTSLPECGRFIEAHRLRHLVVEGADGLPIGLLSDADVWAHGVEIQGMDGPEWKWHRDEDRGASVQGLMQPIEVIARPDEPLSQLFRRWRGSRQDAAVVVDERGHVVGIVTEHDVVAAAVELLPGVLNSAHAGSVSPITASHVGNIADAWRRMDERRVRHLVLMTGTKVTGVMSVRDLVLLRAQPDWGRTSFVGSEQVRTVSEGTSLRTVAQRMATYKIGLMPVIDRDGHLERVISRRDIMDALFAALDERATFDTETVDGNWSQFAPETIPDR